MGGWWWYFGGWATGGVGVGGGGQASGRQVLQMGGWQWWVGAGWCEGVGFGDGRVFACRQLVLVCGWSVRESAPGAQTARGTAAPAGVEANIAYWYVLHRDFAVELSRWRAQALTCASALAATAVPAHSAEAPLSQTGGQNTNAMLHAQWL